MSSFKMQYEKYVSALEAACTFEEFLKNKKEELIKTNNNFKWAWYGQTAVKTIGSMDSALEEGGEYDKAYKYVQSTRVIMEEYQMKIRNLMATREQLGKNLHQDDPATLETSSHVEDELIIHYDYIPAFDAAADSAVENGLKMAQAIREMITAAQACARGYVNFKAAEEMLTSGDKKIKRVENFKQAVDKFAWDMSDFEASMSADLTAKMYELGDAEKAQNAFKKAEAGCVDRIEGIVDVEMDEIFSKDCREWTPDEIEAVAKQYTHAMEMEDVDMLNKIADAICLNDDSQVIYDETYNLFTGQYYGGVQPELASEMLEYIDPYTQGAAYFSLVRIAHGVNNIEVDSGYGVHHTDLQYSVNKNGEIVIELKYSGYVPGEKAKEDLTFIATDLYAEADVKNMEELGFTPEETVSVLSGVYTEEDKEHILQLTTCKTEADYAELFKVNPEKLSDPAMGSYFIYAYDLYEKSYTFDEYGYICMDNKNNSDQLTNFVNGMLAKPDVYIEVYTNYPQNYPNYTIEYLANMSVYADQMLGVNSAIIQAEYNNIKEETIANQYKLLDVYTFFTALEQMEMDVQEGKWNDYLPTSKKFAQIRVSNLGMDSDTDGQSEKMKLDSTDLSFNAQIVYKDGKSDMTDVIINVENPEKYEVSKELNEYNEKVKECRTIVGSATVNAIVGALSVKFPEVALASYAISYCKSASAANASKVVRQLGTAAPKTLGRFQINPEIESTVKSGVSNGGDGLKYISYAVEAYATVAKAYEERDAAYDELLSDWYVGGAEVTVNHQSNPEDDTTYLICEGQYDPGVLINKEKVASEGFASLYTADVNGAYDHVQIGRDKIMHCLEPDADGNMTNDGKIENLDDQSGRTNEEKVKILTIMWCGPENEEEGQLVESLTKDEYMEYVRVLDEILKNANAVEGNQKNIFNSPSIQTKFKDCCRESIID